ncbi:hypothetical protein BP6252_13019 [Coleophoma cylindrospora]|uniref:Zn(2)-C6 fungal-type domain-containing protein n=1 Tax=Coleophoma cylindrospora TaxID=1849047 RepID=A0A3D8QDK0_9HELO|nr:hypothetical protein BP6252_13019 [Coleophoma cylindrospora]
MSATLRQKACISCADSKRRCDKQLPECQRCLDRDANCVYPQRKKDRRNSIARKRQAAELPPIPSFADADVLGNSLEFGDWVAMGAADPTVSLLDVAIPYVPTLSTSFTNLSTQGTVLERGDVANKTSLWFLRDDTWAMKPCNQEPACVTYVELEPFVGAVEEMLQCWVRTGHNSFIHRRLYEKGMPTCLQDAFTTLAAYSGRTPATKETILQIAEERSLALAKQSPPTAEGAQGILAHLARVQALFIYEFIHLFDGSVRLRASAEQQLPTLRLWAIRMWEIAKRYRGQDGYVPSSWNATEFDREYDASSQMWQLWILTESVRRSHLIIDTIANIYDTMTKGWAECPGAVMFTTCRGLWEAESAIKWFELSCAKPPLLVPSLQPGPLISEYAAEEIDDFAKLYWRFIVGTDKIQCWIDKNSKTCKT